MAASPPFGMFTTDTQLIVRTWDAFIAHITGLPADQVLGRALTDALPELESRGLIAIIRRVVANGTVEVLAPALHRCLIECPPSDPSSASGQMRQRVTVGPLRDDGRIVGAAVAIEDVTAPVERDNALRERLPSSGTESAPDGSLVSLARGLGASGWQERKAAVRGLASYGSDIVDTVVRTLRDQHRDFGVLSSLLDLLAMTDVDIIAPLIGCLSSDDVDLRIQAALILGERRDKRAIPALIAALDDADVNVQFHAIESLGTLQATEAVERLVQIAERREFFLAFPAIQALQRLRDLSVAPRLVPLLQDDLLRATVVEALGELGDELVAFPLVQLLNQPHAPTDVVADALAGLYERYEARYSAGEHIAAVVRRTITAVGTQNLLDAVQRVASDRLRGIARVMGWIDGPAVQRALTRLLGQHAVRAQVVEALVRYGAGVVDLLTDQLSAEDLDTRQAAAVALGRIGDRRATPALVAALEDPEVAVPAAGALARIGDPAAFEPLLALLGHPDSAIRQSAIAGLNSIGHPDMPARIAAFLEDANPLVRESAVRVAGYFGYPGCVDRVLARRSDPAEPVRRVVIETLPFFESPATIPAIVHALEHDTPAVRAAAAATLARVDEARALPALLRALDDPDPWVRYFALRSIASFENASTAPAVRGVLERDREGQVRLAAIDALGRLDAAGAIAVLEPMAASAEPDFARAAIRALGHTTDPQGTPILETLLRAAEPWRRLEAVVALGARGGAGAASVLQWAAAADADSDVVNAAIGALAAMSARDDSDAPTATGALIAVAAEAAQREKVIAALSVLPARRIRDVAEGLRHPSPDIRRATIEALSRMKHPEASRSLEFALEDAAPIVRATAVAELRRLGSRHAAKKLLTLARNDPDRAVRHAAVLAVAQHPADRSGPDQSEAR